ncbi:hypothetical protein V6N13_043018 [Hibiscus sabdariffa]|uniref:Uncharacterized protein n=1 Tax=Hibiscus sabdariffa TaxID=183260 RepID=A0ABR2G3F4_9ROSI
MMFILEYLAPKRKPVPHDIVSIKFHGFNVVTRFEITRYDVGKIMASNIRHSRELARRNNEVNEYNAHTLTNCNAIQPEENNGNGPNWKMALCPSSQQQANACITVESLEPKLGSTRNYENSTFSMDLQDFSRTDLVNSTQPMVENPTGVGSEDPNEKEWIFMLFFERLG